MIVDGKALAAEIYEETRRYIKDSGLRPHLTVFTCAPNFETQKYLSLKKRKANEVGIDLNVVEFPEGIKTDEVAQSVLHAAAQTDGIVLQLPFPTNVDVDEVFRNIPKDLDVDVINYDGFDYDILPPVVGAIDRIAKKHDVIFTGVNLAIIGQGRLVGKPAKIWAEKQGARINLINKETQNTDEILKHSQVIISGAGQPGLITKEKIQSGVIIFDAGTSEDGGVLRGDADSSCAEKASLFTPVPGGIGPVTIAILLKNLVYLAQIKG